MKKLGKIVAAVLCVAVMSVSNLTAVPVFAVQGADGSTADAYVWKSTVKGVAEIKDLLSVKDNDSDAVIELDEENNAVKLKFTSDAADVEERKATEVLLDTSKVPGYMHYVSFDMSINDFMDFVATMDLPQSSDSFRPYSLYVGQHKGGTNNENTYCKAAALQHDPDYFFVKDGSIVNNVGWVTASSVKGVDMAVDKSINIKILSGAEFSPGNADREQPIFVYINGVRGGQNVTTIDKSLANNLFNYDKLRFIHYATEADKEEIVTLKNIEVGYAKASDLYVESITKPVTNDTMFFLGWNERDTNRGIEFIRYYVNNPNDYRWIIYPNDITEKSESIDVFYTNVENDKWGCIITNNLTTINAVNGLNGVYSWSDEQGCVVGDSGGDLDKWIKAHAKGWSGNKNVVVTYIMDYGNKTLTVDCNGMSTTMALLDSTNTGSLWNKSNARLKCFYVDENGATKYDGGIIEKIERGYISAPKGINISDANGMEITSITAGTTAGVTAFGNTDAATAQVIFAQYDANNILIDISIKDAVVENGIYKFAPLKYGNQGNYNTFTLVDGAVLLKAFIFDGLDGLKPLAPYDDLSAAVGE